MINNSKTVLSEIKLTSVLLDEIEKIRGELDTRTESIQTFEDESKRLRKQLNAVNRKNRKL